MQTGTKRKKRIRLLSAAALIIPITAAATAQIQESYHPYRVPEDPPAVVVQVPKYVSCPMGADMQAFVEARCKEVGLDFYIVMSVIYAESGFREDVVSHGNYGLMQINRVNHQWLADAGLTNMLDPQQNVVAGTLMLSNLMEKYGDITLALMAYNAGEGGAKKQWKKGIYSTAYTRKVLRVAEEYRAADGR